MNQAVTIVQPRNPATGELWFDVNLGIMKFWSGHSWMAITSSEPTEAEWVWLRENLTLQATSHYHENFTDSYLDTIQAWCTESGCGTRTSFDTWVFENESEITVFLLRWS